VFYIFFPRTFPGLEISILKCHDLSTFSTTPVSLVCLITEELLRRRPLERKHRKVVYSCVHCDSSSAYCGDTSGRETHTHLANINSRYLEGDETADICISISPQFLSSPTRDNSLPWEAGFPRGSSGLRDLPRPAERRGERDAGGD